MLILAFRFTVLLFLSLSITTAPLKKAFASEPFWESVPLRYEKQKAAGLIGGEGFQYVFALTYAPSDPEVAYFAVDVAGVWRSADGGFTWTPKRKGFQSHGARSLAVDPINANVVFAAGFLGEDFDTAKKYGGGCQGIYRTVNGADDWQLVRKTGFYRQISALGNLFVFDSRSAMGGRSKTIYAGSYDEGLLRSVDGGDSWKSVALAGYEITDMQNDPADAGAILIATTQGLYRYGEGGLSKIGSGLPESAKTIAISARAAQIVYAAVGNHGVYKSSDGGRTFFSSGTGLPSAYYSNVAVSPVDPNVVYARAHLSPLRPYYSHDGGATWNPPNLTDAGKVLDNEGFFFSSPFAPHPKEPLTALHVSNGRARILKTTDGGKNWYYSGNGFTGGRMEDMVFLAKDHMILCLTDHGLWETKNDGDTFREIDIKRAFGSKSSSSAATNGQTIVASVGGWNEKILAVSNDLGKSWTYQPSLVDRFKFIGFHAEKSNVVYAGPFRSDDAGHTWKKILYPVMAMLPGNCDTVYSWKSGPQGKARILRSTDMGQSWSNPYPPFPLGVVSINDIAASLRDPDRIYLATSNGLYIFDGRQWIQRSQASGLSQDSFGNCYISSLAIDPNNPDTIYAGRRSPGFGRSNGAFRSKDGGLTWQGINYNLSPGLSIFAIKVNPFDSRVYIGTSLGTYRLR